MRSIIANVLQKEPHELEKNNVHEQLQQQSLAMQFNAPTTSITSARTVFS